MVALLIDVDGLAPGPKAVAASVFYKDSKNRVIRKSRAPKILQKTLRGLSPGAEIAVSAGGRYGCVLLRSVGSGCRRDKKTAPMLRFSAKKRNFEKLIRNDSVI